MNGSGQLPLTAPVTQRQVSADGQAALYAGLQLMARIRTIKPDFWQHPKTGSVSRDARLLFIGLLNEADDEGRMRYSAKRLAGVLFPFDDDVTPSELDCWVGELERVALVARYVAEEAAYLEVCGFTEHQRINRPTPSTLPVRNHGAFSECARGEVEGNREEEVEREQGGALVAHDAEPVVDRVSIVFDCWKSAANKNGTTHLSAKRRRLISTALKNYPVDDVLDAVRGWKRSPFHCGQNPSHKVYNDLELLLRDEQHIEGFRDLERGVTPQGHAFDSAVDAIQRLREMEGR